MTDTRVSPDLATELAELLAEARERTLLLVAPLSEPDLRTQHDPLMSPIVWDLGHIVHFEDLWLTRNLDGPIEFSEMPGLFNPFENPRRVRGALPLPSLAQILETMRDVRERVLRKLETAELENGHPLLRDGYVYRMVAQHEYQHDETILQTLQLKTGAPYAAPRRPPTPRGSGPLALVPGAMVRVSGGKVRVGTDDRAAAYDNERPSHVVRLRPFEIDVAPVTNAEFLAFMRDGGYERRELWSDDGWRWREDARVASPKYWWREADGTWWTRTMDHAAPVAPAHPVVHVCYHEADAYARWAGKRLPTELEWEVSAAWDPATGRPRTYPWGDEPATAADANIDQLTFGTTAVGTFPRNVSPVGCYGLIGDVWEWTSSDFTGYPGFASFPYPEYSEAFFGREYKVLRGGSWATRPGAIRNSFRNWDYPIRRQIFSGFRCARDG